VGKSTKKSPMKRRSAIISCSQNINYINSRSQKPVTCVIVNDPLVLFITFLMYPVLPMYLWIDSRCALEKGDGGLFPAC
jgi:hypothetical protein